MVIAFVPAAHARAALAAEVLAADLGYTPLLNVKSQMPQACEYARSRSYLRAEAREQKSLTPGCAC